MRVECTIRFRILFLELGNDGENRPLEDLNTFVAPPGFDFGLRGFGLRIFEVIPGSNAEQIGFKEFWRFVWDHRRALMRYIRWGRRFACPVGEP